MGDYISGFQPHGMGIIFTNRRDVLYEGCFDHGNQCWEKKMIEEGDMSGYYWIVDAKGQRKRLSQYYHGQIQRGSSFVFYHDFLKKEYICVKHHGRYRKREFDELIMTEFNEYGDKTYEGGYIWDEHDGFMRHGQGKEFTGGMVTYEGGFQNNYYHGTGVFYYNDKDRLNGNWNYGLPHGKGIAILDGCTFQGNWKNGFLRCNEEIVDGIGGLIVGGCAKLCSLRGLKRIKRNKKYERRNRIREEEENQVKSSVIKVYNH